MKIVKKAVYQWNDTVYEKIFEDSLEYEGPIALLCGSSHKCPKPNRANSTKFLTLR